MKKILAIAFVLIIMTTSCVNGRFQTPEQDQEKQDIITLIQFTF